jgi:hypothetical protein
VAFSVPACRHIAAVPFRGMRQVGFTRDGEALVFRCPYCSAEHVAARCTGNTRFDVRCRQAAKTGSDVCGQHSR